MAGVDVHANLDIWLDGGGIHVGVHELDAITQGYPDAVGGAIAIGQGACGDCSFGSCNDRQAIWIGAEVVAAVVVNLVVWDEGAPCVAIGGAAELEVCDGEAEGVRTPALAISHGGEAQLAL